MSISSYYNRKEKAAIQKQQNEERLEQQIAREERRYQEGYQKGYQKGYQEGMERGRKEAERKFQQQNQEENEDTATNDTPLNEVEEIYEVKREEFWPAMLSRVPEKDREMWQQMEADAIAYRNSLSEEDGERLREYTEERIQAVINAATKGKSKGEREAMVEAINGNPYTKTVWRHMMEIQSATMMREHGWSTAAQEEAQAEIERAQSAIEAFEQGKEETQQNGRDATND